MIRVVIADDHHLVRQGIRALLEKAYDIEVVGEASDGQEAIELVEEQVPDVLVIDIAMPRLDGLQAVEQVDALDLPTRVVVLSMYSDKTLIRRALRGGASGYLLKQAVSEELLLAVRSAVQGKIYLCPEISRTMVDEFLQVEPIGEPAELLTPREREVLQLIAEGHTNRKIGRILEISVKTVEKHRANLMAKLEVGDLATLLRTAIRQGLVFLEE